MLAFNSQESADRQNEHTVGKMKLCAQRQWLLRPFKQVLAGITR